MENLGFDIKDKKIQQSDIIIDETVPSKNNIKRCIDRRQTQVVHFFPNLIENAVKNIASQYLNIQFRSSHLHWWRDAVFTTITAASFLAF